MTSVLLPSSITRRLQTRWRTKSVKKTIEKSTFTDASSVHLCQVLVAMDPLDPLAVSSMRVLCPQDLARNLTHSRCWINICLEGDYGGFSGLSRVKNMNLCQSLPSNNVIFLYVCKNLITIYSILPYHPCVTLVMHFTFTNTTIT